MVNEESPYAKIISLLAKNRINYTLYKHKPVYTSEQAANVRGDVSIHQGAKAMVLQADKNFVLYVLPADLRVDIDGLQNFLGVRKLRLASKDSVKAKTGLEVGSIPPLGSIIGLKTYVDHRLSDNDEIAFNAARHDRSIKMKYNDYVRIEIPEIVEYAEKEESKQK